MQVWYKISPAHIYCIWHETSQNVVVSFYYRLSIYRGYIWYDSAHNTTITTMTLRSDLHSRTTSILRPHGRAMGCRSWVRWRKMTAIYREHIILSQIGPYVWLGSCHATVYTTVLNSASSVTARVHNTTFPREFCYFAFASALSVFCHFPGKSIVFFGHLSDLSDIMTQMPQATHFHIVCWFVWTQNYGLLWATCAGGCCQINCDGKVHVNC